MPTILLNTDYKITSTALANRLKHVLPQLIHPNQTCCILKRAISDNCAIVGNIIQHCEVTETAAAVISLDQIKAFDRVDWQYLFIILEKFGCGPSFIAGIRLLYHNIVSHVIVNNFMTTKIPSTRSKPRLPIVTTAVCAECRTFG